MKGGLQLLGILLGCGLAALVLQGAGRGAGLGAVSAASRVGVATVTAADAGATAADAGATPVTGLGGAGSEAAWLTPATTAATASGEVRVLFDDHPIGQLRVEALPLPLAALCDKATTAGFALPGEGHHQIEMDCAKVQHYRGSLALIEGHVQARLFTKRGDVELPVAQVDRVTAIELWGAAPAAAPTAARDIVVIVDGRVQTLTGASLATLTPHSHPRLGLTVDEFLAPLHLSAAQVVELRFEGAGPTATDAPPLDGNTAGPQAPERVVVTRAQLRAPTFALGLHGSRRGHWKLQTEDNGAPLAALRGVVRIYVSTKSR